MLIIELTFLGTASAIPSRSRNHSAIVVKVSDKVLLLDCGESTQRQLMFANVSPMRIDDIFITHLHGDHVLGLPGLIQSMAFRGRTEPLNVYGPVGIDEFVEHIKFLGFSSIDFEVVPHVITSKHELVYRHEDFVVSAMRMNHTVTDYAFKIEQLRRPKFIKSKALALGVPEGPLFGQLQDGLDVEVDGRIVHAVDVLGPPRRGKKIVFSGDTTPVGDMVEFAMNCDVLIHEATYTSEYRDKAYENGHTVAKDAASIARDANVGRLVLTHLSNRYTDSKELLDEAREIFENTVYANDFTKVIVENKKDVQIIL